ncbi:nucleoside hydrolase [Brachybacterium sp. FME24]|uniref:nucleoside hydrolase n=1 Tax=Brachybacterium sp. FME24 TaxID=2742605 RepID=UPI001866A8F3|nr:nucleoside hydrolase [Brachybacterium sp. FME24]
MTRIPTDEHRSSVSRSWSLGESPWQDLPSPGAAAARVIIDNDFAGDPDDLYQLIHHLLSPGVEIRAVIGSHLREGDGFYPGADSATQAVAIVHDVFARIGLTSTEVIVEGSNLPLGDRATPQPSPAVDAIITEALRTDTDTPLYYVAGGGLTDLASAVLTEPRISERLTVVWIGGNEHDDLALPPPDAMPIEYNLLIDVRAAQVVFTDSELVLWQVPRDVYRQCLVSDAELRRRVAATGPVGRYLYDETAVITHADRPGPGAPETYALGDSPLVLLTALRSHFEADTSSSRHLVRPTPALEDDGSYTARPDARPMRVYTQVDTRLMFEDMFLKLQELDAWLSTP